MEHFHSVFSFGSENWSWSRATLDRMKGWETNAMRRLFRFKKKDEMWANLCTRTSRIAESMWRAMVWVCDQRPNTVIDTLKHVFKWRSTKWWQSTKAIEMKKDPYNFTRWKHMWSWHNRGCVWDTVATNWACDEDWACKRESARQLKIRKIVTFALRSVKTFDNTQDKNWEVQERQHC